MRYATIALGGLFGSAVGAWYTERFHPSYAFLVLPFPLAFTFFLTFYVDEAQVVGVNRSCGVKHRLRATVDFMRTPLVMRTALYIFACGVLSLSFGDIMYFFLLDEVGITK